MIRRFAALCLFSGLFLPQFAHAATADLSIDQGSITFSSSTLYAGDDVRIYARIRNRGEVDMTALVLFYQGSTLIGDTQPISLRAGGAPEEVFVDFTVPEGTFNIRAVVGGATPADQDASNNEVITSLYTPIEDADRDGVADDDDNCVDNANADQLDTDGDGKGNACDKDDDADRLADTEEDQEGTDPLDADTDGDGVGDAEDWAPTNPAVTTEPVVVQPVATAAPTIASVPVASAVVADDVTVEEQETPAEETAEEAVDRPSEAFGIFSQAKAADNGEQGDVQSFFRIDNPAVKGLLGLLVVVIVGLLASLIVMRRRDRGDDV